MNIDESPDLTRDAPPKGLVDFRRELTRRIRIATLATKKPRFLNIEKELCRRSPKHFINNWCWTFDPRIYPANVPFRTFPYQNDLLSWIEEGFQINESGLVEKSRDVGASWIFCAWFLHHFLFRRGFSGLFGSRKEDLVDDWTEDSLFGKLRYMLYRLPWFLKPRGFSKREHDNYLRIVNPDTGSKIVGESANDDFGRGARASASLLDEGASIPHSERVLASISQTCRVNFWLSSPKGKNNAFYRLRHKTKIRVKSIHWSLDPRKDDKWYLEQKGLLLPWEVGQELDLSYEQETGEKIYSRFDRRWHVAKEVIEFNPLFEQWVSWDFGGISPTALIFLQIAPDDTVEVYQTYEYGGQDIDFFIPISKGYLPPEFGLMKVDDREALKTMLRKVKRFETYKRRDSGDHAGTARTANSKRSCKVALREAKIDLVSSGKQDYEWRFKCTDRLFRLRPSPHDQDRWRPRLQISPDCVRFIDCLNNYVNSPSGITRGEVIPMINWASHQVTAFEFFCINRFPVKGNDPSVQERRFR